MKIKYVIFLFLTLLLFSCVANRGHRNGKTCRGMGIHNRDVQRGLAR